MRKLNLALRLLFPLALSLLVQLPHESDVVLGFPFIKGSPEAASEIDAPAFTRTATKFPCGGRLQCDAWLYTPKSVASPPPIAIMASGLGVQRDVRLPQFAEEFAANGMAALLFDYRNFGGSEGLPRQLVDARMQLEDFMSAVQYVKADKRLHGRIDPERIVLWGSSYSGGHALAASSKLGNQIFAVVAMEPYVGAHIMTNHTLKPEISAQTEDTQQPDDLYSRLARQVRTIRIFVVAACDYLRGKLGLQPAYIPLVTSVSAVQKALQQHPLGFLTAPISLAVLPDSDYEAMINAIPKKPLGNWKNLIPARVIFSYRGYEPLDQARKIRAPVLLIAGRDDALSPEWAVREAQREIGDSATTVTMDGTHMSLYRNPELIPVQLAFLQSLL